MSRRDGMRDRWVAAVLRTDQLNPSCKLVCIALSRQMDDRGRVRYPRERLAEDIGMKSLQRISDRIKEAKDAQFLSHVGGGINGTHAMYDAMIPLSATPSRGTSSRGRGNGWRGSRNGVAETGESAGPATPLRGAIRARVTKTNHDNGAPSALERGAAEQHSGDESSPSPRRPALALAPPIRRACA